MIKCINKVYSSLSSKSRISSIHLFINLFLSGSTFWPACVCSVCSWSGAVKCRSAICLIVCFSSVAETGCANSNNSMFLYLRLFIASGIHITSSQCHKSIQQYCQITTATMARRYKFYQWDLLFFFPLEPFCQVIQGKFFCQELWYACNPDKYINVLVELIAGGAEFTRGRR